MMKRMIILVGAMLLLTGCRQADNKLKNENSGEDTQITDNITEIVTEAETDDSAVKEATETVTGSKNSDLHENQSRTVDVDESVSTEKSSAIDIGEVYLKEPEKEDIVIDDETGIKYVKNQLLISAFPDTERSKVVKMLESDEYGSVKAEIVGEIALTGDYQIEFPEDMTLENLQFIADYFMGYPFVSNVTLNMIEDTAPAD